MIVNKYKIDTRAKTRKKDLILDLRRLAVLQLLLWPFFAQAEVSVYLCDRVADVGQQQLWGDCQLQSLAGENGDIHISPHSATTNKSQFKETLRQTAKDKLAMTMFTWGALAKKIEQLENNRMPQAGQRVTEVRIGSNGWHPGGTIPGCAWGANGSWGLQYENQRKLHVTYAVRRGQGPFGQTKHLFVPNEKNFFCES